MHTYVTTTEKEGSDLDEEEEEGNDGNGEDHSDNGDKEDKGDYKNYEELDKHPSAEFSDEDDNDQTLVNTTAINKKLKKLTPKELEKSKTNQKTGVCYLSKIPPYMKPSKLRSVLSRFGSIDRIFLKPEEASIYHKRVKYGGNKRNVLPKVGLNL